VLRELKRRGMLRDPNDATDEAEHEPMIGCAQLSFRSTPQRTPQSKGKGTVWSGPVDRNFFHNPAWINNESRSAMVATRKTDRKWPAVASTDAGRGGCNYFSSAIKPSSNM